MSILNLVRDYGVNPCIVRMQTDDSFSTMIAAGYLSTQMVAYNKINGGAFQWASSDMILCYYPGGWQFFVLSADMSSLIPYSGTLPGIVEPSSVLVTDQNDNVFWQGPLTNGQLIIGSTGAAPVANTLTAGTGVTITNTPGSIHIAATGTTTSTTYVTSSPYTVLITDDIILTDTNTFGAPISVILPANPPQDGQVWTVKDWGGAASTFNITVSVAGSANTIDGGASVILATNYESLSFAFSVSQGTYSIVDEANGPGGSGITLIGDVGSVSGSSINLQAFSDPNFPNQSGSSVTFFSDGTTTPPTMVLSLSDQNLNTALGTNAGNAGLSTSSATNSIGIGSGTLANLSSGDSNIALGLNALGSLSVGAYNIAIGYLALNASATDSFNTAIGWGCLSFLSGGSNNAVFGFQAGNSMTTGSNNTGFGVNALLGVTSGSNNTGIGLYCGGFPTGNYNLVLGYQSGPSYTTSESSNILLNTNQTEVIGDNNTLRIGAGTGTGIAQLNSAYIHGIYSNNQPTSGTVEFVTINNTTGLLGVTTTAAGSVTIAGDTGTITGNSLTIYADVAATNAGSSVSFTNSGTISTFNVTDGGQNTLIGLNCGNPTVSAIQCVGLGFECLNALTSGRSNTAIGYEAMQFLTTGTFNVALGQGALQTSVADNNNVAIGLNALTGLNGGNNNTAVGWSAMGNNSGSWSNLTAVGYNALGNVTNATNSSAVGYNSLGNSTVDSDNTALGYQSLMTLNGGNSNTAIGSNALVVSTTGSNNTAIGANSLLVSTTGSNNTAIGENCLQSSTADSDNTAIGYGALNYINGGTGNVGLGEGTGGGCVTGSYNVFAGVNSGNSYSAGESNNILLNSFGVNSESNTLRIGDSTGTGLIQLNAAYIQGIYSNTQNPSGTVEYVTINNTNGLLGVTSIATGGVTIDGDTGSISGSTLTIYANAAAGNSGFSVSFANSGTTSTLNLSDNTNNTFLGNACGTAYNGIQADNTVVGVGSAQSLTTGNQNTGIGIDVFDLLTTGANNTAIGATTHVFLLTGVNNTALGFSAGNNLIGSESYNIHINSQGVNGDNNILRLGDTTGTGAFAINAAYIQGIYGNTQPISGNVEYVTIDNTSGQLGVTTTAAGSVTIAGDTGSISGSSLTIYADVTANNCGASVSFINSGTISTLNVTDAASNTFIGNLAGNTAAFGLGAADNTGIGNTALGAVTSGESNVAIGFALINLTTGTGNIAFGANCFNNLLTGQNNIGAGFFSGSAYTNAESSNIVLNSNGVLGESNVLRIGSATGTSSQQLNSAYIQGIYSNTQPISGAVDFVTINNTTGQLGITATAPASFAWSDHATSFTAAASNGYIATAALTATLPVGTAVGQTISFIVDTAGAFVIQAPGGQTIRIGAVSSSAGGTATNSVRGDTVTLVYSDSSTSWIALSDVGNAWSLV